MLLKSKINKTGTLKIALFIIAGLALIVFLHLRIVVFPDGFDMPINYRIGYFGKSYFELYSIQTSKEKKIGDDIVERAKSCMEYLGSEEDAPENDALSYFYHWGHFARPVRAESEVSLRKSVIHGNKGSVWIEYSQHWYDENDEVIYGAGDVLAKCEIVKDDSGEWIVTTVSEPP